MISDILKKRSEEGIKRTFLCIDNEKISYTDFDELADKIANSINIENRLSRVKLNFKSKKLLLASIVALNRLQKIPIIFPPEEKLLKNIDYDSLAKADMELNDNNCIIQQTSSNFKIYNYKEDDIQCVLFTTGSVSGIPMCVELTFENIYCSSLHWSKVYKFSKNDIYVNILPLFHISGLSIFFRSLYNGFYSVYKNYDKNNLHKILIDNKATCMSLVPKMFNDAISSPDGLEAIQTLQFIILGGDSITYDIFKKCSDYNIKIYSSYGLTETSSGVAGYWINNEEKYVQGFIGYPHFNTEIFIKKGNIGIKSKTVMKKYSFNNDLEGIYISSDRAETVDGRICYIGRNKDLIVSGGVNINLKNIEDLLKESTPYKEVVLVSHKDDVWGETPIVIYQSEKESLDCINEIRAYCKENLPKHMVPRHFMSIKNIPRYDNFKVNYNKLNQYVEENFK